MPVAYVEYDERDGDQDATARNRAHAYEQWQRNGPQIMAHDRAVLRDLWTGA